MLRATFRGLKEQGFSFAGLFKYNDFHEDGYEGDAFSPAEDEEDGEYRKALRRACLQFYGRAEWARTYGELLQSGY